MDEANPSRATLTYRRVGSRIVTAVAVIVLPLLTLWGACALWYQITGGHVVGGGVPGGQIPGGEVLGAGGQVLKVIAVVVWVAFGLATLIAVTKGRAAV